MWCGMGFDVWEIGVMFCVFMVGELYGLEFIVVMEGLFFGVFVFFEVIQIDFVCCKFGYGCGLCMKFEQDELMIFGGVWYGCSFGSFIVLCIGNMEWLKWVEVMNLEFVEFMDWFCGCGVFLMWFCFGYVDFVGMQKYDFDEVWFILECVSVWEIVVCVVLGVIV